MVIRPLGLATGEKYMYVRRREMADDYGFSGASVEPEEKAEIYDGTRTFE
jgi:hypothetical protein